MQKLQLYGLQLGHLNDLYPRLLKCSEKLHFRAHRQRWGCCAHHRTPVCGAEAVRNKSLTVCYVNPTLVEVFTASCGYNVRRPRSPSLRLCIEMLSAHIELRRS